MAAVSSRTAHSSRMGPEAANAEKCSRNSVQFWIWWFSPFSSCIVFGRKEDEPYCLAPYDKEKQTAHNRASMCGRSAGPPTSSACGQSSTMRESPD